MLRKISGYLLIQAGRFHSKSLGCVIIGTVDSNTYDDLYMSRTSFLSPGWSWKETTYLCHTSDLSLNLLKTNRQIYQEASRIFYSRNMFYAQDAFVIIPFLKDRSSRSRAFIRKLSVVYSNPIQLPYIAQQYSSEYSSGQSESQWEDVCCYIASQLPDLLHLDLRVRRDRFQDSAGNRLDSGPNWDALQSALDFPKKRRKELATINPQTELTVSEDGWSTWDDCRPDCIILTSLRPWLANKVERLRQKNALSLVGPARDDNLRKYWKAHRKFRPRVYVPFRWMEPNASKDDGIEDASEDDGAEFGRQGTEHLDLDSTGTR